MTLRPSLIAAVACAHLWTSAAGAQELQAGQTMTQPEADRLEAVEADNDRMEAEEADMERRDRRRERNDMDAAEELASEMDREAVRRSEREQAEEQLARDSEALTDEWLAEETAEDRRTRCIARLPASERAAVEMVIQQYKGFERDIRSSGGANTAEAIARLNLGRDHGIDSLLHGRCR